MIKKVIKLVLVILWMGLIFLFSNDTGKISTEKSDGFIIRMVEIISRRELSESEKDKWTTCLVKPVRKGAHLSVYLVLGILIVSFVIEFMPIGYKANMLAIGLSFIYACSDEVHQYFVPGRSGMFSDVVLDTIGASVGVLLVVLVVRMCKRREQKERIG